MPKFLDCVTVYRVERDERGPYDSEHNPPDWTTRHHGEETGCPGPYDDDGLYKHAQLGFGSLNKHVFGFTSIEQFSRWFEAQELWNLAARGYKLSVYEASNVIATDFQCVFYRHEAVLLETRELI